MSLWNIIRDFFVQYIFGGSMSDGSFIGDALIGQVNGYLEGNLDDSWSSTTNSLEVIFFNSPDGYIQGLSLGDYLSTTATIIVLVLLCFLLVKLAIWIFKLGANLIRLR